MISHLKLCRLCGSLLDDDNDAEGTIKFKTCYDTLKTILNVEILHNEKLPSKVCDNCVHQLDSFSMFRENFFKTQSSFELVLGKKCFSVVSTAGITTPHTNEGQLELEMTVTDDTKNPIDDKQNCESTANQDIRETVDNCETTQKNVELTDNQKSVAIQHGEPNLDQNTGIISHCSLCQASLANENTTNLNKEDSPNQITRPRQRFVVEMIPIEPSPDELNPINIDDSDDDGPCVQVNVPDDPLRLSPVMKVEPYTGHSEFDDVESPPFPRIKIEFNEASALDDSSPGLDIETFYEELIPRIKQEIEKVADTSKNHENETNMNASSNSRPGSRLQEASPDESPSSSNQPISRISRRQINGTLKPLVRSSPSYEGELKRLKLSEEEKRIVEESQNLKVAITPVTLSWTPKKNGKRLTNDKLKEYHRKKEDRLAKWRRNLKKARQMALLKFQERRAEKMELSERIKEHGRNKKEKNLKDRQAFAADENGNGHSEELEEYCRNKMEQKERIRMQKSVKMKEIWRMKREQEASGISVYKRDRIKLQKSAKMKEYWRKKRTEQNLRECQDVATDENENGNGCSEAKMKENWRMKREQNVSGISVYKRDRIKLQKSAKMKEYWRKKRAEQNLRECQDLATDENENGNGRSEELKKYWRNKMEQKERIRMQKSEKMKEIWRMKREQQNVSEMSEHKRRKDARMRMEKSAKMKAYWRDATKRMEQSSRIKAYWDAKKRMEQSSTMKEMYRRRTEMNVRERQQCELKELENSCSNTFSYDFLTEEQLEAKRMAEIARKKRRTSKKIKEKLKEYWRKRQEHNAKTSQELAADENENGNGRSEELKKYWRNKMEQKERIRKQKSEKMKEIWRMKREQNVSGMSKHSGKPREDARKRMDTSDRMNEYWRKKGTEQNLRERQQCETEEIEKRCDTMDRNCIIKRNIDQWRSNLKKAHQRREEIARKRRERTEKVKEYYRRRREQKEQNSRIDSSTTDKNQEIKETSKSKPNLTCIDSRNDCDVRTGFEAGLLNSVDLNLSISHFSTSNQVSEDLIEALEQQNRVEQINLRNSPMNKEENMSKYSEMSRERDAINTVKLMPFWRIKRDQQAGEWEKDENMRKYPEMMREQDAINTVKLMKSWRIEGEQETGESVQTVAADREIDESSHPQPSMDNTCTSLDDSVLQSNTNLSSKSDNQSSTECPSSKLPIPETGTSVEDEYSAIDQHSTLTSQNHSFLEDVATSHKVSPQTNNQGKIVTDRYSLRMSSIEKCYESFEQRQYWREKRREKRKYRKQCDKNSSEYLSRVEKTRESWKMKREKKAARTEKLNKARRITRERKVKEREKDENMRKYPEMMREQDAINTVQLMKSWRIEGDQETGESVQTVAADREIDESSHPQPSMDNTCTSLDDSVLQSNTNLSSKSDNQSSTECPSSKLPIPESGTSVEDEYSAIDQHSTLTSQNHSFLEDVATSHKVSPQTNNQGKIVTDRYSLRMSSIEKCYESFEQRQYWREQREYRKKCDKNSSEFLSRVEKQRESRKLKMKMKREKKAARWEKLNKALRMMRERKIKEREKDENMRKYPEMMREQDAINTVKLMKSWRIEGEQETGESVQTVAAYQEIDESSHPQPSMDNTCTSLDDSDLQSNINNLSSKSDNQSSTECPSSKLPIPETGTSVEEEYSAIDQHSTLTSQNHSFLEDVATSHKVSPQTNNQGKIVTDRYSLRMSSIEKCYESFEQRQYWREKRKYRKQCDKNSSEFLSCVEKQKESRKMKMKMKREKKAAKSEKLKKRWRMMRERKVKERIERTADEYEKIDEASPIDNTSQLSTEFCDSSDLQAESTNRSINFNVNLVEPINQSINQLK